MEATLQNSSNTKSSPTVKRRWLKPLVFLLSLLPFLLLVTALLTNQLGPNPIEELTGETGEWALRFIVLGLMLSPLRWWLKQSWPVQLRRMIGLFAFFYASVHLSIYLFLDQMLDVSAIISDLLDRPYITAGTVAFFILLPLAVTSNKRMVKKLGTKWQSLHRWVYLGACAAVVHYVWLAKGDRLEPFAYLTIVMGLFVLRLKRLLSR